MSVSQGHDKGAAQVYEAWVILLYKTPWPPRPALLVTSFILRPHGEFKEDKVCHAIVADGRQVGRLVVSNLWLRLWRLDVKVSENGTVRTEMVMDQGWGDAGCKK